MSQAKLGELVGHKARPNPKTLRRQCPRPSWASWWATRRAPTLDLEQTVAQAKLGELLGDKARPNPRP